MPQDLSLIDTPRIKTMETIQLILFVTTASLFLWCVGRYDHFGLVPKRLGATMGVLIGLTSAWTVICVVVGVTNGSP